MKINDITPEWIAITQRNMRLDDDEIRSLLDALAVAIPALREIREWPTYEGDTARRALDTGIGGDGMSTPLCPEHANKTVGIIGADKRYGLQRVLTGYAYPANGNVHNPTPNYSWWLQLDGVPVGFFHTAREAKQAAKEGFALDEELRHWRGIVGLDQ